ncbi:hypothetical protein L1887_32887 [Cichorium endivia]|nr:hypothetical protein L1887_32887 [Cichorium endivia]
MVVTALCKVGDGVLQDRRWHQQLQSTFSGKAVHGYAIRMGFLPHIVLETALIDMYGKCGNPNLSEIIFNRMDQRNLILI